MIESTDLHLYRKNAAKCSAPISVRDQVTLAYTLLNPYAFVLT